MNDTPARKGKFRPIVNGTITPTELVEDSFVNSRGGTTRYFKMLGAGFQQDGKQPTTRTVMAFGKSADAVRDQMLAGEPVRLAVQYDGGTVRIIGPVIEKDAATV